MSNQSDAPAGAGRATHEPSPDGLGHSVGIPSAWKNPTARIADLELSVRTGHCLRYAGVQTVRDLEAMTEVELLRIPNFGRKSLNEVKRLLADFGTCLGAVCREPVKPRGPSPSERLVALESAVLELTQQVESLNRRAAPVAAVPQVAEPVFQNRIVTIQATPDGRVSRHEAARILGYNTKTLAEWQRLGRGPKSVRVGGRRFYKLSDLERFARGEA